MTPTEVQYVSKYKELHCQIQLSAPIEDIGVFGIMSNQDDLSGNYRTGNHEARGMMAICCRCGKEDNSTKVVCVEPVALWTFCLECYEKVTWKELQELIWSAKEQATQRRLK
jgi:hypothetical protein